MSTAPEYKVDLDIFHGPLDLLLYLLKRDELDIYDIPIARITDSYIEYINMLRRIGGEGGLDINMAGDFLVMAATLMEIKSVTLLPKTQLPSSDGSPSVAQELADPRLELVRQLLEYRRIKDAANLLEARKVRHEARYPRQPAALEGQPDEPPPVDLDEVQIWDLLSAFDRLMREVGGRKPKYHEVLYDDTPIDLHAADIEDRLKREPKLTLRELIAGRKSRSEMIGVFLALLELIREKKILVEQSDEPGETGGEMMGELEIVAAPPEHQAQFAGASLHLSPSVSVDESVATDKEDGHG